MTRNPIAFVVLGLLHDRPMHGYELKKALSPALPRERQVNDGVLYPLLGKLHADGLVRKSTRRSGNRPARHVYEPTEKGRLALRAWLAGDDDEGDEVSYDFLVGQPFLAKAIFFEHLPAATVRAKLERHLESARTRLAELRRVRAGMVERGVDPFRIDILDLGLAQQRAKIRWLRARLAAPAKRAAARRGAASGAARGSASSRRSRSPNR